MSPRTDEFEQDNTDLSATSSDDDDDGLIDDMAALARACTFTADEDEIEQVEEDPLLSTGDAIVPFTANEDSDPDDDLECLKRVQSLYKPTGNSVPSPSPVPMIAAAADDDEDDEDDFETVRAIFKRFSAYDGGGKEAWAEGDQASSLMDEQDVVKSSISDNSDAGELCPDSQDPENNSKLKLIKPCGADETCKNDAGLSSQLPKKRSSFPPSAQAFIDAVKKNRALQKFLRSFMH